MKNRPVKILAIIVILLLLISALALFILLSTKKDDNTNSLSSPVKTPSSDQNLAPSDLGSTSNESNTFRIPEENLELKTDLSTSDLIYYTDTINNYPVVFFTLENFLRKADDTGFSSTDNDGINNCKKLVSVTVFSSADSLRQYSQGYNETYIDSSGNPMQDGIYKLNDGRYAKLSQAQASCNGRDSKESAELQDENLRVIGYIRSIINASLTSY